MAEAAVLEKPAVTTETTADSVAETKDETKALVTDGSAKTEQTETDASSETTKAPAVDHAAELERDADDARKAEIRQELEKEDRERQAVEAKAEKAKAEKAKKHATFETNIKAADKMLDNLDALMVRHGVTDDNGRQLVTDRVAYKSLLEGLNLVAAEVEAERYRESITAHLPEGTDAEAWLAEQEKAPDPDITKTIGALIDLRVAAALANKVPTTLDEAKKIPAIAKELVKVREEEYKAGLAGRARGEGQGDKAADGTATPRDMTYQDYLKLSETDKRAFNKKSPEKFRALLNIK